MLADSPSAPLTLTTRSRVTTWNRLGAFAGIGFAVLFVAGMIMFGDSAANEGTGSEAEVLAYYADSGNRVKEIVGMYLLAFAGMLFLGFLAHLRTVLNRFDGEASPLSGIASTGGTVFVALLFAAGTAMGAVSAAIELGDVAPPGVDVSRMLPQLGNGLLLLFGMFAASAMILAASILVLRSGQLPRWLGWLGVGCGVLLLLGVAYLPIVALPIWVIATSIALLRQPTVAS